MKLFHAIRTEPIIIKLMTTNHYFNGKISMRRGTDDENDSSDLVEPANDGLSAEVGSTDRAPGVEYVIQVSWAYPRLPKGEM